MDQRIFCAYTLLNVDYSWDPIATWITGTSDISKMDLHDNNDGSLLCINTHHLRMPLVLHKLDRTLHNSN